MRSLKGPEAGEAEGRPLRRDDPRTVTACDIWSGADWPEREVYDLMGIVFEGHPRLSGGSVAGGFRGFIAQEGIPAGGDDSWRNFLKEGAGE